MRKYLLMILCMMASTLVAQVWQHVDPRIGSVGVGRTFPGPCMPFGMVKPGPDCGVLPNAGWTQMPEPVLGFSQTHVSGTGGGQKYGNVLIQPYLPSATIVEQASAQPGQPWRMIPQRRVSEDIALGYYSTTFDSDIRTEITTAERCSFYRIHYPSAGCLFVDVTHFLGKDSVPNLRERQQFVGGNLQVVSDHEVTGHTTIRGGWNNGDAYTVFFCLQTDAPFLVCCDSVTTLQHASLSFHDTLVNLKIGISYVSVDQARRNIPAHNFDTQLSLLRNTWEQQLSKVQIAGTPEQCRMFYTALYHTMLMPVDKTGEAPFSLPFREGQGVGSYYDDYYAIWDTYRTSSPLLTLLCPDRQAAIVNSLLNIYAREGYMPDARSGDCNGRTQGGSNAEVVIADAFAKQLGGIDYQLALEAMLKDATVDPGADHEKHGRGGLTEYNRLGYIPYGIDRAGNRTMEYAFCDWCIAQVARGLGQKALAREYLKKSRSWCNLWRKDYEWDGMRGFILPKDAQGRWLDSVPWGHSKVFHPTIPYTPVTKVAPWYLPWWSTFFYEATSEEYSLSVPHDVPGLIRACGGKKQFRQRLDLFFEKGYYNVQNEPSFLTPCLYHWIDRPDLSTQRIHQIVHDNYTDRPDGLPGNDDSGAMSSWLAFHMMGLYPNAGTDYYLLNLPLLPEYTFHLSNGRSLHVTIKGTGDTFKAAYQNGKRLRGARITHQQLMQGGELLFESSNSRPTHGRPTPHRPTPQPLPMREGSNIPLQQDGQQESQIERVSTPLPHREGLGGGSADGGSADGGSADGGSAVGGSAGGEVSFTLNRQFRTWPISYAWDGDTLSLICKQTTYRIARTEADHATGFCWLSPQTDGTIHHNARGTFCFISRDALQSLLSTGFFLYDSIIWRRISKDQRLLPDGTSVSCLRVRADIDATEMLIALPSPYVATVSQPHSQPSLPFVLEMQGNPLGIDWTLTLNPSTSK